MLLVYINTASFISIHRLWNGNNLEQAQIHGTGVAFTIDMFFRQNIRRSAVVVLVCSYSGEKELLWNMYTLAEQVPW